MSQKLAACGTGRAASAAGSAAGASLISAASDAEIIAAANEEAESILQNGRAAAERERAKMLSDAQEQLGALAVELSGRILGREVTDADNRRIIDSFFGEEG